MKIINEIKLSKAGLIGDFRSNHMLMFNCMAPFIKDIVGKQVDASPTNFFLVSILESNFNKKGYNASTSATGYTQFVRDRPNLTYKTIRGRKFFLEDLRKMTTLQYFEVVSSFWSQYNYKALENIYGLYLTNFQPAAVGKPLDWVFPRNVYNANSGIDKMTSNDGRITIRDFNSYIDKRLKRYDVYDYIDSTFGDDLIKSYSDFSTDDKHEIFSYLYFSHPDCLVSVDSTHLRLRKYIYEEFIRLFPLQLQDAYNFRDRLLKEQKNNFVGKSVDYLAQLVPGTCLGVTSRMNLLSTSSKSSLNVSNWLSSMASSFWSPPYTFKSFVNTGATFVSPNDSFLKYLNVPENPFEELQKQLDNQMAYKKRKAEENKKFINSINPVDIIEPLSLDKVVKRTYNREKEAKGSNFLKRKTSVSVNPSSVGQKISSAKLSSNQF